mgnify:CR=1 FL=1|tara:strand:- start:73 stop:546 length:474 start_codon:yes stop_codon:yes gene_type:complete
MPNKSSDEHQNNSRIGAFAESLVQTFLLEYCDFCFPCQDKHPADLLCELGPARYTVQVKARNRTAEGKYAFAADNSRSQSAVYKNYHCDILAFVFMPEKRILFKANSSSQNYFTFDSKIITLTLEADSFQETLNTLSEIPVVRPLIEEADKKYGDFE